MSDNWIVAPWDTDNPLDPITGETAKANQALRDYAAMGAGRSLRNLLQKWNEGGTIPPTKYLKTLADWSTKFHWQARLVDYIRIQDQEREQQRAERRQQLEDDDWKTGDDLRKTARALLSLLGQKIQVVAKTGGTIDNVNVTVGQITQALKIGSELQRLSTDEPTANINLSGAALDAAIEAEFRRLADIRHGQQARAIVESEADVLGAD